MPITLKGSCHCKAIEFELESNTPAPYQLCQCSICRKTGGYMGSVNIMGNTDTLKILKGEDKMKTYKAFKYENGQQSGQCGSTRKFCGECSTMLWVFDEQWAHWIYPYAACIDTELPKIAHGDVTKKGTDQEEDSAVMLTIMRSSAPGYVPVPEGSVVYDSYPPGEGIEAYHKKHKLWVD